MPRSSAQPARHSVRRIDVRGWVGLMGFTDRRVPPHSLNARPRRLALPRGQDRRPGRGGRARGPGGCAQVCVATGLMNARSVACLPLSLNAFDHHVRDRPRWRRCWRRATSCSATSSTTRSTSTRSVAMCWLPGHDVTCRLTNQPPPPPLHQVGPALRPMHDKLDNTLHALRSIKDKPDIHPKDLRGFR